MAQPFRKLQVWQRSKALAVAVYRLTSTTPLSRDRSLCDQIRRAAVSVCSNIAEGDSRQTEKESVQFFYIAKGSVAEASAQLEIAIEIFPSIQSAVANLVAEGDEISAMLQGLIKYRRS